FFQALHRISLISNLLIQHYRENVLSSNQTTVIDQLDDDFQLINQSLCLRNSFVFQEKPARILDLFFYLTQYEQADIHSDTLRQLQISL
ncbi:TPA: bifunctional uridylyltransferase/uridylyl-removing protein GlnD, partial [Haemophilus influenzae]